MITAKAAFEILGIAPYQTGQIIFPDRTRSERFVSNEGALEYLTKVLSERKISPEDVTLLVKAIEASNLPDRDELYKLFTTALIVREYRPSDDLNGDVSPGQTLH